MVSYLCEQPFTIIFFFDRDIVREIIAIDVIVILRAFHATDNYDITAQGDTPTQRADERTEAI